MNKERRVGRRSVVQNLVKLTPEYDHEDKSAKGPKKILFDKTIDDDSTFAICRRRTLKPLHEINNFQFSSSKSKSHERLNEETAYCSTTTYMDMFNKHNKIPVSPPSRTALLESSLKKSHHRKPHEPVLQSKELFNTLIDSPCTKFEKVQFNNALSSASKYLLERHLESVKMNADKVMESPEVNLPLTYENDTSEFKTPHLIDLSITPKQNAYLSDCQTQTSNVHLLIDEIEEFKKNELENIRQSKLQCSDLFKTKFKEIELGIENLFTVMENKVTENYDKLLKKVSDEQSNSTESTQTSIETVKEKNYTRMTGAFGILNNLDTDCSFLKTPKLKGKTREEMLSKGILTPSTMSFVLQEQLMNLNSST